MWIDTENQVRLIIMDKQHHDYDYTEPKRKRGKENIDREIWTDDKLGDVLARLYNPATGSGILASHDSTPDTGRDPVVERAEQIQKEIRRDKGLN